MGITDTIRESVFESSTVQKISELFGTLTKFILQIELAGANIVFTIVFLIFVLFVVSAITSPIWLPRFLENQKVSNFSDLLSKMFSGLVKFFK